MLFLRVWGLGFRLEGFLVSPFLGCHVLPSNQLYSERGTFLVLSYRGFILEGLPVWKLGRKGWAVAVEFRLMLVSRQRRCENHLNRDLGYTLRKSYKDC